MILCDSIDLLCRDLKGTKDESCPIVSAERPNVHVLSLIVFLFFLLFATFSILCNRLVYIFFFCRHPSASNNNIFFAIIVAAAVRFVVALLLQFCRNLLPARIVTAFLIGSYRFSTTSGCRRSKKMSFNLCAQGQFEGHRPILFQVFRCLVPFLSIFFPYFCN